MTKEQRAAYEAAYFDGYTAALNDVQRRALCGLFVDLGDHGEGNTVLAWVTNQREKYGLKDDEFGDRQIAGYFESFAGWLSFQDRPVDEQVERLVAVAGVHGDHDTALKLLQMMSRLGRSMNND